MAAAGLAAVGWFAGPYLALVPTVLIAVAGVPAAIIHSAYLLGRRSSLPRLGFRHEARRVAALMALLLLLIPANWIPTSGKRRLLKRQGRAAVAALERQHERTGLYPDHLGDVEGAPWLRAGLLYRSDGQDYQLRFEDPGYYGILDLGMWSWDRANRSWSYERYD